MNTYHYHPETHQFLGTGAADRDPLDESTYLAPAWSTTTAPPIQQAGKTRHFSDGAWTYRDIPEPVVPGPVPAPTPAEQALKQIRELENAHADGQARMTRVTLIDLAQKEAREFLIAQAQAAGATTEQIAAITPEYAHSQLMLLDKAYKEIFILEETIKPLRDIVRGQS